MLTKRICLTPKVSGVGGMVSFRHKMTEGLIARGYEVTNDLEDTPYDAVLVIGGTRNLFGLWKVRQQGIRIVQRLNGMNWLHKLLPTGTRHKFRAWSANQILAIIRRYLSDAIIYQSAFSRDWWNREFGEIDQEDTCVHNGVDLEAYSNEGAHQRPESHYKLLLVEGSLGGGYEIGLETAVALTRILQEEKGLDVELEVVGKVTDQLRRKTDRETSIRINWRGLMPRDLIPELDRSAHLLYSGDINAACPNSVIEAMACGLPVLGFDTGAIPELVLNQAGAVVAYGGNPWKLDSPDTKALADAAVDILENNSAYRQAARENAEAHFGLDKMVEDYLKVLLAGVED